MLVPTLLRSVPRLVKVGVPLPSEVTSVVALDVPEAAGLVRDGTGVAERDRSEGPHDGAVVAQRRVDQVAIRVSQHALPSSVSVRPGITSIPPARLMIDALPARQAEDPPKVTVPVPTSEPDRMRPPSSDPVPAITSEPVTTTCSAADTDDTLAVASVR